MCRPTPPGPEKSGPYRAGFGFWVGSEGGVSINPPALEVERWMERGGTSWDEGVGIEEPEREEEGEGEGRVLKGDLE